MSPSRSHSLAAGIRLTMSGSFNLGMGNLERVARGLPVRRAGREPGSTPGHVRLFRVEGRPTRAALRRRCPASPGSRPCDDRRARRLLPGRRGGQPPGRPPAPGHGPDPHPAPALPQLRGRHDAGRGVLPHDARGDPTGIGGGLELVGGGAPRPVLPRAILRLPPPRGARRPGGALPDPPPRARPRPGAFGGRGQRVGAGWSRARRPRGRRCTGGPRRSAWPCTR